MIIDLKNIQSIKELHSVFKKELGFPDFYGENWDAFWDSIIGLVEMPPVLILENWNNFATRFPDDSSKLTEIITLFNKENKNSKIEKR